MRDPTAEVKRSAVTLARALVVHREQWAAASISMTCSTPPRLAIPGGVVEIYACKAGLHRTLARRLCTLEVTHGSEA